MPNAGGAATEADFDAEEQVVYAALLAQQYPASLYVLQTETGVDATWGTNPPLGGLDALDAVLASMITDHSVSGETTASFAARNATAYPVATDMNIGAPYVLITDQEIAQLRASFSIGAQLYAQLREWQARYPGADCIMQLSRVGFNSSLDQALVYAATDYGVGWAEGDFYVLQKCSSGWLVTYKERNWYS